MLQKFVEVVNLTLTLSDLLMSLCKPDWHHLVSIVIAVVLVAYRR